MGKQFTSEYQPVKNGRHKGPTATDLLRKLSKTKISFHNPITNKTEIGTVNLVVAMQLILKATQDSDLPSIKEYFDRLDGKVPQPLDHSGKIEGGQPIIIMIPKERQEEYDNRLKGIYAKG